ncbi:hypothetical protein DITRI_Ditri04bG0078500 [Diplodiscus trichospermus]
MLSLFLSLVVLQQHFDQISASRSQHFRASPTSKDSLRKTSPSSINLDRLTINRYKMTETQAYRPTSPGHSPGVGHDKPPSAP